MKTLLSIVVFVLGVLFGYALSKLLGKWLVNILM